MLCFRRRLSLPSSTRRPIHCAENLNLNPVDSSSSSSDEKDQKLSKLVIDPAAARDFERPLKSQMKSENQVEHSTSPSDYPNNPFGNKPSPEETQNP